jgi:hypothetical protein
MPKPSLKVGTICYATTQGLGILAKDFVDHGVVSNILVVEHSSHPTNWDWHPGAPTTKHRPWNDKLARDFCASMDVMLFFETPFDWNLIPHCREHGVKTALMVMHECSPERMVHRPDLILAPSLLDHDVFPGSTFIQVPVDVPWRIREYAGKFVHNAGHGGLRGRNGTKELLESLQYVKSPVNLIIRSQKSLDWAGIKTGKVNVSMRTGTCSKEELWDEGDVFVFPEKFNGLSLPLQEARAAGMMVMCGDRFPMNKWLPKGPLVPVQGYRKARIGPPYMEFNEAIFDPVAIAMTIDAWAWADISSYSLSGKEWAKSMSWDVLKPRYLETLGGIK